METDAIVVPETKRCNKCGEVKPLEMFGLNKKGKFGHNANCKTCVCIKKREYNRKNREKQREWSKKYREKNPEGFQEAQRKHDEKNRERTRERKRKYNKENPDKGII